MSDAGQPASRGYRLYVLIVLIVVYTFNFLDRQILSILKDSIKVDLNLTDTQLGLMGGLSFALLYSLLAVPIAWAADRWSRVWIMTGAVSLWSIFTALCGGASNFTQLFMARVGVGVGEAGGVAPAYSLIADYYPKASRARALAAYSFGIPLGTALGILSGGLIAHAVSWRAAFITVGVVGLLLGPLLRLTVRDPVRGGQEAALSGVAPSRPPPFNQVTRLLFAKPSFWLLAFGAACSSTCGYGVAYWLPTFFLRSLKLTLVQYTWYYSAIALVGGVAGIWLGGALSDRWGAKSKGAYPLVPAICFLIALPIMFAAMNSSNLLLAFLLFLVPTGLNLAWLGPIIAAVQHLVPASMRTTASALFLLINNLVGLGLGLYYFGAVSDFLKPQFGAESMRYAIYTGGAFYLGASLLFLLASRRLARDWVD
jgi:MFS family permease